jgi:hypothetical protein
VTARPTPRTRRARLTPDEQRKIVGLYADANVSNAEIRQRFAITDTSLYRLLQKHGVPLRGRSASRTGAALPNGQAKQQFRVDFRIERIVVADSVRDALQQAALAGATDVTAIVRE